MTDAVEQIVREIEPRLIAYRRDFHRHAESGWTEFRTASRVARALADMGYEVHVGREVLQDEARLGLPEPDILEDQWQRARAQGGDTEYLDAMRGGFTGIVGLLREGKGPTVGLRFDIDALDLAETQGPAHRPVQEGFASVNEGVMHACGHDAHTAIGLGVAEVLARLRRQMKGTLKLVFQPAEEGVRGAKAMVAAGVVDDVNYMIGMHVFSRWQLGHVDPGRGGFLATTKFDALFDGKPAHAGHLPNEGNNALLAAATAVLNLHAIPRHNQGKTRINVGRLMAGSGRNVVPDRAQLAIECRGSTTELNDYMHGYALRILESAAAMHGCRLQVRTMGGAQSADSDAELRERIGMVVDRIDGLCVFEPKPSCGSEDFTYMMNHVQGNGGLAANIGIGANLGGWGHHTAEFDIDERALALSTRLLATLVLDLCARETASTANI